MGELVKPGAWPRGDHRPLEHPLVERLERLREAIRPSPERKARLVCSVCGKSFTSIVEAWLHQEETGHKCFRIELGPT